MRFPFSFRLSLVAAAASVVLLAASAFAADTHSGPWPEDRNGWLIGFGVGGGSAGLKLDGESADEREDSYTGSFRVGHAFSNQLALDAQVNGWTREENGSTGTFDAATVGLSFYPGGHGLMLRGGVGLGGVGFSNKAGNVTTSTSEIGYAAHAGAGYEFRAKRTLAIGPQFNWSYVSTDSFKADWIDGEVAFVWYFLPKP